MSRIKPYTTTQVSWNTILNKKLRIPMNQREYSWESPEIMKFLYDIFEIFEENKYVEKMGSIINLNYDKYNDIYDGQQRIITTILILNVIGCLSEKLKHKINQLLTIDTDLDTLTSEQETLKSKHNVSIIPKLYCINPFDMEGLIDIFNCKVESYVKYLGFHTLKSIESFDEDDEYICKCGTKISRKSDFIKHIEKQHKYVRPKSSSKLYNSFVEIYNYFNIKNYNEKQLINLYKFILNDIDIQYYECNDPEYVSRIFDWENDRGQPVQNLDIMKNQILVQIPDEKKCDIYNKWESLKHTDNAIYKNIFGKKMFDLAIQIYNNKVTRIVNHEELYKPIINNIDTHAEIMKFFKIVEKLFQIMILISQDKFGRLINNSSRVCLTWEAYMWCLLPICYKTNKTDTKLIELMTKWYFRNLQFKTRSFNNLCYSNEFIRITNEVFKDKDFDYYKEIESCLQKNKVDCIFDEYYLQSMKGMNFKSTNATYLLLFLETCINTDIHKVSLEYTLEHIYCQKNKNKLTNQSLMDNIGNLTLIEGKNSGNGHRGNSSLGSKPYDNKKTSYAESSCKITRMIPTNFTSFTEENILERNTQIVKLLNKYTNY